MCIIWLVDNSDHGAIAKLSFVHGLLFLVCVTRTLRLIHLSWQMWTCFGKRKVEMYNYGGKLSRQDHWTLFFTEKPEQGTWHHDILGMFCYESCCGREVQVYLVAIMLVRKQPLERWRCIIPALTSTHTAGSTVASTNPGI